MWIISKNKPKGFLQVPFIPSYQKTKCFMKCVFVTNYLIPVFLVERHLSINSPTSQQLWSLKTLHSTTHFSQI